MTREVRSSVALALSMAVVTFVFLFGVAASVIFTASLGVCYAGASMGIDSDLSDSALLSIAVGLGFLCALAMSWATYKTMRWETV